MAVKSSQAYGYAGEALNKNIDTNKINNRPQLDVEGEKTYSIGQRMLAGLALVIMAVPTLLAGAIKYLNINTNTGSDYHSETVDKVASFVADKGLFLFGVLVDDPSWGASRSKSS